MKRLLALAAQPRHAWWVLAGAVFLVYLNSLGNAFQYDDKHAIVANPHLRSLAEIPAFFVHPEYFSADPDKAMYRPLLLATLALNYAWSGSQTYSYHLVNIALHALCSLLVWALLRQLGRSAGTALLAGLVFALHPLCAEPVNYISSRSELLAAALVLAACWGQGEGRRWLGVGCFALALLSKESAIVLPALLLWRAYNRGELRAVWPGLAPYGGVALLYLVVIRPFLAKAVYSEPVRGLAQQWGTQAKALVYYLKLLAMPTALSVHHAFQVSPLSSGLALLCLALAGSLALCGRAGGRGAFALGAGWMLIALAPTSLVPLNILVNEHRLYLPLVGLLIWLSGMGELPRLGRAWLALPLALGLLVLQRNAVWRDEGALWADALAKAPGEVRPYVFLGNHLRAEGQLDQSAALLQRALQLEPDNLTARANLGTTYERMGRYDLAIGLYEGLVQAHPEQGEMRYNLALNYQRAGQLDRARDQYLSVPTTVPHYELVLNNLGALQEQAGRPDSAYYYYSQALARAPELADALNNCQRLREALSRQAPLFLEQGRSSLVEAWCRQVLAQEPGQREGLFFLAVALFAQGHYAESIVINQKLVELHPGFGEGQLQLANALESAGRPAEAAPVYRALAAQSADASLRELARQRLQNLERRRP
jgi:tetratricopeptide (TPR) repeat protein